MSRAEDRLVALARDIGPRPACEEGEREAGDLIREIFEAKDLSVELQRVRSPRTYSYTYLTYFVLAGLVAALAREWPGWSALAGLVVGAMFFLELDTRLVLARAMPRGTSRNVIGRLHAARAGIPKVVVITAHYDSARAALPFAPRMVPRFRLSFALTAGAVWGVGVLGVANWAAALMTGEVVVWIWYAMIAAAAYLLFPIALYVHRELAMPWVDGANDNASGVVALLEILERFAAARRRAALRGREGAEEAEGEVGAQTEGAAGPALAPGGTPSAAAASGGSPAPGDGADEAGEGAIAPADAGVGDEDWGDVAFTDWLGLDGEWDPRREGQRLGDYSRVEEEHGDIEGPAAEGAEPGGPNEFERFAGHPPAEPLEVHDAPDLSFAHDGGGASAEPAPGGAAALGDEALADKEIWFVATCCEEAGTVGMVEFLKRYGGRLRDACFINLDNLGGGRLAFVSDEGMVRRVGADRMMLSLAREVADTKGFDAVAQPYHLLTTDATAALTRGYRAMSLMAFDERGLLPNWHWETDTVERVRIENIEHAADFVYELVKAL